MIVDEEEELVLDDRAADGTAELIPAKLRLEACAVYVVLCGEAVLGRNERGAPGETVGPGVGVEDVVTDELEGVTVKLVGAGLDGDADDAAKVVAVGSRGVLGDEIELLDGIDTGREGDLVVVDLVVVHAVEDVAVGLLAVAVDVGTSALEAGLRTGEAARVGGDGAGREQRELLVVAGGERQGDVGVCVEDGTDVAGIGLEERRRTGDFDGLGGLSDGEGDVDAGSLCLVEGEGGAL